MTITIKTAIHPGIYASQGGGTTAVRAEANTGPRNLIRLAGQLSNCAASATLSYGNIGHQRTWLEIDGVRIDSADLREIPERDDGDSPTTKAKALIGLVSSGEYAAWQARVATAMASDEYLNG